jgi:GlpG protein
LHIGQQVYEVIAVQNNISNIVGIVGAIIVYGLNVKAKYGLYR